MLRPNILIFMTDQQRGDTVLPTGQARMPNIDRFRAEGVTFGETFCPSPHCCPSRATFMTGLYPAQHGIWHNVNVGNAITRTLASGVRTWCEDLSEHGYRMRVVLTNCPDTEFSGFSVDTAEDLARAERMLRERGLS